MASVPEQTKNYEQQNYGEKYDRKNTGQFWFFKKLHVKIRNFIGNGDIFFSCNEGFLGENSQLQIPENGPNGLQVIFFYNKQTPKIDNVT